jgi:hypothetical protein
VVGATPTATAQIEGRFTFSKPVAGCPPGDHRFEIQGGEQIVDREYFRIGGPRCDDPIDGA